MLPKRYMIIDGPSIGHAANNGTTLTVGKTEVQAIFGFVRTLHKLLRTYTNITPVITWDGASWRRMMFTDYKAARENNATKTEKLQQIAKTSFKNQQPYLKKAATLLGIDQVFSINMEADDLGAIMADRYSAAGRKVMLVTGDKDWIQLVGPNVTWIDPINDRKVTTANFAEFTGCVDAAQFVELKCLMGDMGDSVPGVGGIGEKGGKEFLAKYGSFGNFSNMLLDGSLDPTTLHKKYQRLADEDKRLIFSRNLALMDLRTKQRPVPVNLTVTKGTPSKERFQAFCEALLFNSITKDLDNWMSVFPAFQVPWEEEQAA